MTPWILTKRCDDCGHTSTEHLSDSSLYYMYNDETLEKMKYGEKIYWSQPCEACNDNGGNKTSRAHFMSVYPDGCLPVSNDEIL